MSPCTGFYAENWAFRYMPSTLLLSLWPYFSGKKIFAFLCKPISITLFICYCIELQKKPQRAPLLGKKGKSKAKAKKMFGEGEGSHTDTGSEAEEDPEIEAELVALE